MHDPPRPDDPPPHAERASPDDPLLGRTLALVRFLRAGCPWDARQDHHSLRPHLLEEAHEVAEAIATDDEASLRAELGDLLLNVAFQIVLAEERRAFGARDVVEGLEAKMEARHPHLYGEAEEPPDWEALKVEERRAVAEPSDPFAGVAPGLEPLSRALRTLDRAGALGFEWPTAAGPVAKLEEETGELSRLIAPSGPERAAVEPTRIEEEVGDVLLAAVAVARAVGAHPSNALLAASARFRRRFRAARRLAEKRGSDWDDLALDELEALWAEAREG